MTEEKKYKDLIPVIVEREGASLPEGFDSWGVKTVHPDLKAYGGYQWPFPGNVAVATDVNESNTGPCPDWSGDGLCVGLNWEGMASTGITASTLLLVAYRGNEVLGRSREKIRTQSVAVVALVDGERLLREAGEGADLRGAYLQGAYLRGASLQGANLQGADLRYADLQGAYLQGAIDLDKTGAIL